LVNGELRQGRANPGNFARRGLPERAKQIIVRRIIMNSTVTVSELQAQTPKVIRETERRGFTSVSRHGKIVAVMLSHDRIEAMIESMELLNNPEFMGVLKDYQAGKLSFKEIPADEN
jgi:hypothetical protein